MKIEALTSFCGVLSMAKGEVRDCSDAAVVSDLLHAGYIREAVPTKKQAATRKAAKKDESQ